MSRFREDSEVGFIVVRNDSSIGKVSWKECFWPISFVERPRCHVVATQAVYEDDAVGWLLRHRNCKNGTANLLPQWIQWVEEKFTVRSPGLNILIDSHDGARDLRIVWVTRLHKFTYVAVIGFKAARVMV